MKKRILYAILFGFIITGCSKVNSGINTSDIAKSVTVASEKSAIVGQIINETDNQPLNNVAIRLAQVFWDPNHETATFVLEGATSPGTFSDKSGTFIINDVTPGEYVVLIGDVTDVYDVIKENSDTAKVFLLTQGQVLDIGTVATNILSQ